MIAPKEARMRLENMEHAANTSDDGIHERSIGGHKMTVRASARSLAPYLYSWGSTENLVSRRTALQAIETYGA
jgi:hypothetical protein